MVVMNNISCPAVLISAPASGQGKTLSTAALARAWKNRGLKVRVFKCGPDFLDPMILAKASGHAVYNLDLTMCGADDGQMQLYNAAQEADVIIVEGVMGLYDGTPSSADIALRFNLPVLLTIDAGGMAQTFGALASGLLGYQAALKPAGVLANKVGSPGHASLLHESLPAHLAWFGALPKDAAFALPERHLGLFRAHEIADLDARIEAAAQALAASGELALPPLVSFAPPPTAVLPQLLAGKTIAIARDEAFCFIYPANIDCLQAMGANIIYFSLLHDLALPAADAYWLPGGYPELHLPQLSSNHSMRQSVHAAFAANTPILAECGGMMALTETIATQSIAETTAASNATNISPENISVAQPVFGLLPGHSQMQSKLQGLGVLQIPLPQGTLGAHTFHYASMESPLAPIATAKTRFGKTENIYQHGSIHASFLHYYFASNPAAAAALLLPR
jgi:cobyrinic acid a,c-diamide synthase